jgi:hypothetical protein
MNPQRRNRFMQTALVICALLVGSVSLAQTVNYHFMPGIDWSKYHTYKWVTVSGAEQVDPILDAQIKQSIDSQLAAKGFVKATGPTADLDIAYQAAIKQQEELHTYGPAGGWRLGGGMATVTQTTISIGTLDFDAYDEAAQTMIWRGSVTKTLNPSPGQTKKQQNLDNAMAKLLQNFGPPPPKK